MDSRYYKEDEYWVSPFNFKEGSEADTLKGREVEIHDATLRDGEQTPGVVFSKEDKVAIAEKLIEAGVTRIEAGMPAVSQMDYQAIAEISSRFPEAKIYAFARAMNQDIDMARDAGVTGVVIEIPIGAPKLRYQFNWTWEKVLEKSIGCIQYARSQGLKAVYFPYDTTRADEDDLDNLLKGLVANDAIPDSIGVVDTMGCATASAIQYLVRKFKTMLGGISVEVHTHNDFGVAVANELAGLMAGADVLHSCVNGLGERTGNAATEELILNLQMLYGYEDKYDLKKLQPLCDLVASISGIPFAPNKPFCGPRNYTRESGIGVDLVVKKPLAMFATSPAYFGRTADVALGKKSGKLSVEYYLDKMGITADADQVAQMLALVKERGIEEKRLLTIAEFEEIVKQVL